MKISSAIVGREAGPDEQQVDKRWLRGNTHNADLVLVESPVEAMARARTDATAGAIVGREAALAERIPILADRASDQDTMIRFAVIAKEDGLSPTADRTALAVRLESGGLTPMLGAISSRGVEMLSMASLPGQAHLRPLLFLELGGKRTDAPIESLLDGWNAAWGTVHVLGSFTAHRPG
jgi:prephenate dehydratase